MLKRLQVTSKPAPLAFRNGATQLQIKYLTKIKKIVTKAEL